MRIMFFASVVIDSRNPTIQNNVSEQSTTYIEKPHTYEMITRSSF